MTENKILSIGVYKMAKNRLEALQEEEKKSKGYGSSLFSFVNENLLGELGITEFKSQMDDNFIAVLDPYDGEGVFWKEVKIHQNIGANRRTFLCPLSMENKPCPICEEIERIKAKKNQDPEEAKKILSKLYPKTRFLFYVVDTMDESTIDKGVRYYDAPSVIKNGIVKVSKHKRTGEFIDVTDPENGKDISFTKTKTGKESYNIEYAGFQLEDRTEILEEWLDLPDFDDILDFSDYDEIKEAFIGVPSEEKSDDSEIKSRSRKKSPAKEEKKEDVEEKKETRRSRTRATSKKTEEKPAAKKEVEEEPAEEVEDIKEDIVDPAPAPKKESIKDKIARLKREAAERNS